MKTEYTGRFPEEPTGLYTLYTPETEEDFDTLITMSRNPGDMELHLLPRYGEVAFVRVSSTHMYQDILENGIYHIDEDYIMDLGRGIYAAEFNNECGVDNIKTYIENFETEDILVITGVYTGRYYECITIGDHQGYLLFKQPIPSECIQEVIQTTVSDFLYDY